MRFQFIRAEKAHVPIAFMCRHLEVSRAGFYAWCTRPERARTRATRAVAARIRQVHDTSRGTYGSPRVHADLVATGTPVGRHRVAALMRRAGLRARRPRRFVRTTDSRHDRPIAPNVLARDCSPPAPDRAWAADITDIWTHEGWLYLAIVVDLFSRYIVGWATRAIIDRHLVLAALGMALHARRPSAGLVHHSDRGSQYASAEYQTRLAARGITCSMSRTGNCWDNAVAESFFSTLKAELVHESDWPTRAAARAAVFEWSCPASVDGLGLSIL